MNRSDYVAELHRLLQSHPLIAWYDLDAQSRGEHLLFLRRKVEFLRRTILDFKEFVECHPGRIERFKYAYNCRQGNRVLFRYDNATDPRAKHLPTYPAHKHEGDEIRPSPPTDLPSVVKEIVRLMGDSL